MFITVGTMLVAHRHSTGSVTESLHPDVQAEESNNGPALGF